MSNSTTTPAIPAWLDAWLFGVTYVGPLTSFLQLTQATKQSVQVDSIGGAFQVNFPSGMQPNDYVEFVDVGNQVASNNVTLNSVNSGYNMQSPATGSIGTTSYNFGSNEKNGSRLIFQLIVDPNIGAYLKNITDVAAAGSGGASSPPGAGLTGNSNPIPAGNTTNWGNTATGIVYAQISAGASDGEKKTFKNPGNHDFIIQSTVGANLFSGSNAGVGETSLTVTGGANDLTLTWIAQANGAAGGWYT